jgi:hypothetical protein
MGNKILRRLAGTAYELTLAGSFGLRSPRVKGDASHQHGSRQRRNALYASRCPLAISRSEVMRRRIGAWDDDVPAAAALWQPLSTQLRCPSRGLGDSGSGRAEARGWWSTKSLDAEVGGLRGQEPKPGLDVAALCSMRLFPGTGEFAPLSIFLPVPSVDSHFRHLRQPEQQLALNWRHFGGRVATLRGAHTETAFSMLKPGSTLR